MSNCDCVVYCKHVELGQLVQRLEPFPFASRPLEAELAGTMLYLRDWDELRVHRTGGVDPGKSESKYRNACTGAPRGQ
jgi:hypothetical protein